MATGKYLASAPTLADKETAPLRLNENGELITAGSGSDGTTGATSSVTGMANVLPELQYTSSDPTLSSGQVINARCDSAGNLLINPGIYNGTPTETSVSVATSDTAVLNANTSRVFLCIQNQDGTNPIYIAADGNAAVADGTCFKIAAGQSKTWENGFVPSTAIRGISTGGTVVAHVSEVTAS